MNFCTDNASDINRYFRGTFLKFPSYTGDQLYFVDQVSDSKVTGKFFENGETQPFQFLLHPSSVKSPVNVEFILPKKSFFMCEDQLYYLYRLPSRQYHRGIHKENTAIIKMPTMGNVGLSFELLNAYVQKQTTGSIDSDVSVLSPRIARFAGNIYLDRRVIATIPEEGVVQMKEKIFQPEIEAILKKTPGWVVADDESQKPKVRRVTKKYGVDEKGNLVDFEEAI